MIAIQKTAGGASARRWLSTLLGLALVLGLVTAAQAPAETGQTTVSIGGGPMGGTFRHFAGAIAESVSRRFPEIDMISETSGGSLENVRRLHAGQFDFAIAYAGDIFLGADGKLPRDPNRYDGVRPMGYLYGAPAQMVVRAPAAAGGIDALAGKRIAVGNPGSGAALSAERYFRHLELWDKMQTLYLGYATAAKAFNRGRIDAFWVLVGYPNAAVKQAADHQKIALLPVGRTAAQSGFYEAYGFYTPVTIPAGTYPGVTDACDTFQDSALLCTRAGIDETVVYKVMQAVWSSEGLATLRKAHKAAAAMSTDKGLLGVPAPLAPGAARFWKEKKLDIPAAARP
jgi:hypothetical protein